MRTITTNMRTITTIITHKIENQQRVCHRQHIAGIVNQYHCLMEKSEAKYSQV